MEFVITKNWIDEHCTERGGYTNAQLKALGLKVKKGYSLKDVKNCLNSLVGNKITYSAKNDFELGREIFAKRKRKKKKKKLKVKKLIKTNRFESELDRTKWLKKMLGKGQIN